MFVAHVVWVCPCRFQQVGQNTNTASGHNLIFWQIGYGMISSQVIKCIVGNDQYLKKKKKKKKSINNDLETLFGEKHIFLKQVIQIRLRKNGKNNNIKRKQIPGEKVERKTSCLELQRGNSPSVLKGSLPKGEEQPIILTIWHTFNTINSVSFKTIENLL